MSVLICVVTAFGTRRIIITIIVIVIIISAPQTTSLYKLHPPASGEDKTPEENSESGI